MVWLPGPGWRLQFALEREGQAIWSLQSRLRGVRIGITAILLLFLIVGEARDGWFTFFHDYPSQMPARNFPLERTIARSIAEFADSGPAYVRAWPYWYNGTVVSARLESEHGIKMTPEIEVQVAAEDVPGLLPTGRVMVILNPEDIATLAALQVAFPRYVVGDRRDYEGKVAYLMFVGER
jgi:hypothetical protein